MLGLVLVCAALTAAAVLLPKAEPFMFKTPDQVEATRRERAPSAGTGFDPVAKLAEVAAAVGIGAAAGAACIACARLRSRRRRRDQIERWELVLGHDDLAEPYQVEKALETVCGELRARWFRRSLDGQDHLALEFHRGHGERVRVSVAGTPRAIRAFRAQLAVLYPDVELRRVEGRPDWCERTIRLKKARHFVLSLATTRDYTHSFSEALASALSHAPEGVTVQLVLTPAPRSFQRRAERVVRERERSANLRRRRDPSDPGAESVVAAKEAKGSIEALHRSLFFFDLRVSGNDEEAVRAVAGTFDALRSENELVPREMRLRRALYARRVLEATANPIPSFLRGVISTSELATLWQLPRGRAKHAPMQRQATRRAAASPGVRRADENAALVRDGRGGVALWPVDRKFGVALIGGQGMGKTSVMARIALADALDPRKALIVLDPKEDLARLLLRLMPAWRTVWCLDLGRPELGLNPLTVPGEPQAVASLLVQALIEASPPGAIQSASDRFLRMAAAAVVAVEGHAATLQHMYELLGRDNAYRAHVVTALAGREDLAQVHLFWNDEFPDLVGERRFSAERLDPPRNKLARLIAGLDVALRHPCALDIDGVIDRREVLIVNGAKGVVGEDNTRLMGQLILQLVHRALQRRQHTLLEGARLPVSLCIDEAHNFLTPTLATALAEGRAPGLEATLAWQYNGQIVDPAIRAGLMSLLHSACVFRMREVEEARAMAALAMETYSDRIDVEREVQERLRFSVDDVLRLPQHRCLCLWSAGGVPQPAFVGSALPTAALVDQRSDNTALHLERQRDRGAHPLRWLPEPADLVQRRKGDPAQDVPSNVEGAQGQEPG